MNRLTLVILAAVATVAMAVTAPAISAESDAGKKEAKPVPDPVSFTTQHSGTFGGQRLRYTATAGETYLQDKEGKPSAAIFSVAYVKDGVDDLSARPVTFIWNGGPGSASLWLHMGAFGPKRVAVPSDARDDGAPPYPIVDNPLTILDVSDMVFVDPVGTGYSRALGSHEGKEFWGVSEDAKSVAQFMRQWISTNRRWNSPKYIAGESYGTTRAAAVANELDADNIALNGIVLISTILDFSDFLPLAGRITPYVISLPTMAATAHYHGKAVGAPEDLEEFLDEARAFAAGDYALALMQGDRLQGAERDRIRARLAYFTGLSEDYLEKARLKVSSQRYFRELLRDEGLVIGRLDSRYTGTEIDDVGETPEDDPASYGIGAAYTAAVNEYFGGALEVSMDRPYIPSGGLFRQWKWEHGQAPFPISVLPNVTPYLERAMRRNKDLRVMNAAGYYDFATVFYGVEHSFPIHGLDPDRVAYKYYHAGHMMYLHDESRQQFLADVRAFILAGSK